VNAGEMTTQNHVLDASPDQVPCRAYISARISELPAPGGKTESDQRNLLWN